MQSRFYRSLLCCIRHLDIEEHLIRLLGFGPAPEIFLLYTFRHLLQWSYGAIRRELFERTLRDLAVQAQELLSRDPSLSPRATAIYFSGMLARLGCRPELPLWAAAPADNPEPRTPVGDTKLSVHFPNGAVALRRAVARVALRLCASPFSLVMDEALGIFSDARNDDVFKHVLKGVGFDPCAADEVRQRTLLAVYLKCFDYDSKRGSLIAFTLNHANYCVKEYWREQQRRRREVPFGPDEDEAAALHEYLIKFLNETDPWLFDEELGELRAAAKLQLLEVLLELNRRADQLAVFALQPLPDMRPRDLLGADRVASLTH